MTAQTSPARTLPRLEFIALVAGLMALNALAIDIMLPALPYMGEDLGVSSENERQLVVSVYMIGFGLAQIVFGPITDRFGRRAPLFVGMAIYILCAFLATFATSFAMLLALRFVQGLGAAATRVIATSVVRDRYAGREMAEIMSLTFMVFMAIPIIAPGVGQVILLTAPWHGIFLFMAGLAALIFIWALIRLPESLHPEYRRELRFDVIVEGFRIVFANRTAFFYGLGGMFLFGAMFGFIVSTQQIFVGVYGLGEMFPVAFAVMAGIMAVASYLNSRIVRRYGMRRIGHFSTLVYIACGALLLALAVADALPFWAFFAILLVMQFVFSWIASNFNSLSMEPLGNVAGTAAAVFGFMQTVGGAVLGTIIGQMFDGTLVPNALAWTLMGLLVLACALIAENGKLFGVGQEYSKAPSPSVAD